MTKDEAFTSTNYKIHAALLGEDCRTSSDCNTDRGLCCKLQRRAKSQPKKVPSSCFEF